MQPLSKKCVQAFDITLKRSDILTVFLCLLGVLALLSCWLNALATPLQVALSLLAFGLFLKAYKNLCLLQGCQLKKDGSWLLHTRGASLNAILLGSSTVFVNLALLHFKTKDGGFGVILANDSFVNKKDDQVLRHALKVYKNSLLRG